MKKFMQGHVRPYYIAPPITFELAFQKADQAERVMPDESIERANDTTARGTNPKFVERYEYPASTSSPCRRGPF
jgi:hypothetical protein